MKRITSKLIYLLSFCWLLLAAGTTPLAAQTDVYIHFAGQGKYTLYVDDAGTLSAVEQTDSKATPTGGMSWTITGDDTNGYILYSGSHYLKYDGSKFVTTDKQTDATVFDKRSHTYYPETRTSLVLRGYTLSDGSDAALGMENGQLVLAKVNSRFDCLRLANNVFGPDFPKYSQEDGTLCYNIQFVRGNSYMNAPDLGGNLRAESNNSNFKEQQEYAWRFIKADDEGNVYIENLYGGYIKSGTNGTDPYSLVRSMDDATKFRLMVFNDNNHKGYFSLYELNTGRSNQYINKYNDTKIASYSMDEGGRLNISPTVIAQPDIPDETCYLHFAGQGKNALFANSDGTVTVKEQTDKTAMPADGMGWIITKKDAGFTVRNILGKYLKLVDNANDEDCSFTTVDAENDATLFNIRKNNFHPNNESRFSLIISNKTLAAGGMAALGMKHGKITVVPYNTRYDCLRFATNVVGIDFPKTIQEGGGYYNISFPYTNNRHIRVRNVGGTIYTTANPAQATINSKEYLWQFEETADGSGEVYIKSFFGGYMNSAGSDYILTALKSDATRFKLAVFNDDEEYNTTFAIYEIGSRSYDRSFMNARGNSDLVTFWEYNSGGSRVAITENNKVKGMTHKYIQFSGSGNMILFDNGEGKLEIRRIIAANVNQKGYFWSLDTIKPKNDKNLFRLLSEEGNYVTYDTKSSTFKTTPDKEEATTFDGLFNTYMLNGEFRYNLNVSDITDRRRAMGLEQGSDGELHLVLTETDTRMACVRITDNIPVHEFPKLCTGTVFSDDENSTWYSIYFRNGNNYLYKTGQNIYCQPNPTDITGPLFKWRFIRAYDADGIYRGDVYIQNQSGYFIKWDGSNNYELTTQTDEDAKAAGVTPDADGNYIPADATPLRITCYNDDNNTVTNSGWHIRTTSGGGNVYMYNRNGQPGRTNGPKAETSIDITNINAEYFRYVVFAAAGSRTLCDGLNREDTPDAHPHAHRMESGEVNQDHLRWHLQMVNSKGQVILKNRFGRYLTWNEANGFGVSENKADAYAFDRERNYYEDNKRLRYELLKNDDPTKALSIVDLETGELGWEKTGTRFSVLYTFETVAGPALPESTLSGSDLHLYRIRMQEGSHYCITDPNTQVTGEEVVLQEQDDGINQLWSFVPHYPVKNDPSSFIGDYYLMNVHGKYLTFNKDRSQIITQTDTTGAAVIRPIETNSHYYSWQLQVVGLGEKNILSVSGDLSSSTSLTLGSANNNNNFFRFLPESIYPDFYDLDGGSWSFIRFGEVKDMPFMQTDNDGNVIGNTSITDEELAQWKYIGNEKDFILRNGKGQFIKEDENGQLILTDNLDDAKHFYLWMNHAKDNKVFWSICELPENGVVPEIPTRITKLNTDSKVYMVDYTTGMMNDAYVSHECIQNVTPFFSNEEQQTYYFINMGDMQYMNDGPNGVHDAKANAKNRLNGFIWRLDGQKNELKLVSRNGEYLVWNPGPKGDNTFKVSTDSDSASIFSFHCTDHSGSSHTDETDCYFELTGGIGTEGFTGRFIARNGEEIVLTENETDAYVHLEHLKYFDAGDYKSFRIIPKRSWFLYQAMNSPYEPITGFLPKHEADYGWTKNEYTGKMMQATNTFRITHYMKQGTARDLTLPTILEKDASGLTSPTRLRAYQRWYDYKTDNLIPDNRVRFIDVMFDEIINSRRDYSNGTIMGVSLPLNYLYGDYIKTKARFEMPEITTKDYNYLVGVDCSMYTDFVDYFGDNGPVYSGALNNEIVLPDRQNFIEPTLSQRCIYEIRDARQMADSLTACTNGSNKWVEQQTITFPRKKMGFKRPTVPLNLQLQDYWFYKNYKQGETPSAQQLQNIVCYDNIYFEATSYKNGAEMNTGKIGGFDITEWPVEGANAPNSDLSHKRFVRFLYPKADGTGVCNEGDMGYFSGDSCIIKVFAREGGKAGIVGGENHYQLARIKLLFENDIEPRLFTEIMGLDADGNYKTNRSPDYMNAHYGNAKASIDFDDPDYTAYQAPPTGKNMAEQGNSTANGNAGFTENNTYAYPLRFENSGYNYQPTIGTGNNVTWGGYTIAKRFRDSDINVRPVQTMYKYYGGAEDVDDSYASFLYVDASEMPGEICSLEYTGNLCNGTRLYFSAWVSSVNHTGVTPVNIVFTVYGITSNGERENLYTYCPGPITSSVHDKDGNVKKPSDFGTDATWQQIYFSFVNNANKRFEKYVLTINNACTNSSGADMMIDDVRIYSQSPIFRIEKTTPVCGQQITLAKMSSPFDALTTSLGLMEKTGEDVLPNSEMPRLWYTIIDKEKYEEKLTELLAGSKDTTTTHLRNAFNAAIVGKPNSTNRAERAFRYAVLNTNYSKISDFSFEESVKDIIDDKDPNATGYIRKEMKGLERNIVISDQLSAENLIPDHDYYIVFIPLNAGLHTTQSSAFDDYQWGSPCCIMSEFRSGNAIRFLSNGTLGNDDKTINACAGETIGISPQMKGIILTYNKESGKDKTSKLSQQYATDSIQSGMSHTLGDMQPLRADDYAPTATSGNDDDIIYKIEHYDWWMDFMGVPLAQAFIDKNGRFVKHEDMVGTANEVSVIEALISFRHFFPKANSPKDADVEPRAEIGYILTDVMIEGLANLEYKGATISATGDISGTSNFRPLIFNNSTLNLSLPNDMNEDSRVMVTTYPILVTSDDIIFCSDPQTVDVKISGKAPSMADGFYLKDGSEVKYPADKINIPVRTSVAFLKKITATADESTSYTGESMRIPLRNIKVVNSNAQGLQPIVRQGDAYAYVYLSGTNDPNMKVYEGDDEPEYRRIGVIKNMEANSDLTRKPFADIYFLKGFEPREGYIYTLRMEYKEKFAPGESGAHLACDGSMAIDLFIVPKYVVWTGNADNSDWNNDANWKRADLTDLNLTAQEATDDGYMSNEENGTLHAFAPLDHTSVIIPDGTVQPELYNNGVNTLTLITGEKMTQPILNETATQNVQWDLATHEKSDFSIECYGFYNHDIKDMVLKSGAELLRSDYLTKYDSVWVEYNLNPDRWYTLGSPIKGVYAGDWYTDTENGHDLSPYFKPQTFTLSRHNRFAPAIYQKSWDKGVSTLYYLSDGKSGNELSTNVFSAANWSQVYNDVDVRYGYTYQNDDNECTGIGGFSVKPVSEGIKTDNKVVRYSDFLIRIPKEDRTFAIYQIDGTPGAIDKSVDREKAHKLYSDDLAATGSFDYAVTNATLNNKYFLVGNPFICGLDMNEFMEQNKDKIETKYWMLTANGQTASIKDETSPSSQWITINGTTAAANGVLTPGQGFFVKAKDGSNSLKIDLTFTTSMMTSAHATKSQLRTLSHNPNVSQRRTLRIRANRAGHVSEAVIVKDTAATNAFDAHEDMEAIYHNTLADFPMVYTIAGKQAAMVNRRKSMHRIPVGVQSNSDTPTLLTFSGMNEFNETLSLLDDLTGEVIPLTLADKDSVKVEVAGNTAGRYFILTSEKPTPEEELTDSKPIVEVIGNKVSISANASHVLTHIHIVDAAGRTVYTMNPYLPAVTVKLPAGIYVIDARTESQSNTVKVTVN